MSTVSVSPELYPVYMILYSPTYHHIHNTMSDARHRTRIISITLLTLLSIISFEYHTKSSHLLWSIYS